MTFEDFYTELKSDEVWFTNEYWRNVPGYEGQYAVSESGKVMRLPHIRHRRSRHKGGNDQKYGFKAKLLKPYQDKRPGKEYWSVSFCGSIFKIHRLVAMAWHPNPENKPFINHKDYNKSNNHYSNLEWCTAKENSNHSSLAGRFDGHNTKLTEDQVRTIKHKSKLSSYRLALIYNVTHRTIQLIRKGITWKQI